MIRDLAPADVRRYDRRLRAEPLIYTDAFPERWRNFRMDRLTTLVVRLRESVRGVRPSAVVSAAVFPDPVEAATERLQDWKGWLARNLIDVICPMAYTVNSATFATQITTVSGAAGSHPVWAGIGAYRLTPDQTVDNIQTARRLGAGGIILFSYDSLTAPAHDAGYLNQLGRAAFAPSQ